MALFAFTAVFVTAFHDPQPHRLQVAIVGAPPALGDARSVLDPQQFSAVPYASAASARRALTHDRISGALIGPHVLIASASGFVAAQMTTRALQGVAARAGEHATVSDLRPLPRHDSRGLSPFLTVTSTTMASIVFAMLLTVAARTHALWVRVASCALVAALGGVIVALSVDIVVGALTDNFWGLAGVVSLLIGAVVLSVHGLGRLLGPAGAGAIALTLVLVGLTSSGAGVGHQLEPGFYRDVSQLLPNGAAVTAVRNEVYFAGAHTLGAIAVLCAWAAAGALALATAHRRGPLTLA